MPDPPKAVIIGDPAPPEPVLLQDLSETIGSALAAAQRQLDRFATNETRFVIDDVDITLPVKVSVTNGTGPGTGLVQ